MATLLVAVLAGGVWWALRDDDEGDAVSLFDDPIADVAPVPGEGEGESPLDDLPPGLLDELPPGVRDLLPPELEEFFGEGGLPDLEEFFGEGGLPDLEEFFGEGGLPGLEQFFGEGGVPGLDDFFGGRDPFGDDGGRLSGTLVVIDGLPPGWRIDEVSSTVEDGVASEVVRLDGPVGPVTLTVGAAAEAGDGDGTRLGGRVVVIEQSDERTTITWTDDGVAVQLDAPGTVELDELATIVAAVEITP